MTRKFVPEKNFLERQDAETRNFFLNTKSTKETKINVLINVPINVQLMLQEKALWLNINYDIN
jgi:hypothetical protein